MQFINFINLNKRKLIIDDNLSDANNIIKTFCLSNKASFTNYDIFNINLLAETIFFTYIKDINYINNEQSNILFYSFLNNKRNNSNLYNLIPDSSFSFESTKICLSTINEIRKGKRSGNKNINIDSLINDYEEYLIANNYYDDVLLINKTIEIINKEDINSVKKILKINNNEFVIGIIDTYLNKLSYIEHLFLDTLINKLQISLETLIVYEKNNNLTIKSFKTYGFYQEIENVINIIDQNKLSISDVAILVSDDTYLNSIKAYFDNYKIPYSFSNGVDIKCFDIYGLIDSIIELYNNYFSITYLYDIYRNNALKEEYKNYKQLKNLHADNNDILKAINSNEWSINQKEFITDLLSLKVNEDVYNVYIRLLSLINKYCLPQYIELVIDTLNSKHKIFELYSKLGINDNPFDLIRRTFEGSKISIKQIDATSITINKLTSTNYLFKKHNFLLGLSSSQLKQKEVESPLLSDEDIANLIDVNNYYVELPSKRNIRFNDKLDRLIINNDCSYIYLSYSEYDSNEYKNLSASTFFNKYSKNEENPIVNPRLNLVNKEINNIDEKIIDNDFFNKIKKRNYFSPSSLNTLYKCPLQYIYTKYYVDISLNEYNDIWLEANESGTLTHKILENYYNIHKDKKYDESSFEDIFNKASIEAINNHPFDNKKEIDSELKKIHKVIKRYISSNIKDDFKVLGCEIKFKNTKIIFNDKEYLFTGQVDRVDYYKVPSSNELHIRIYDYKTGKEKKLDNDGLTQSFIYIEAIKEYLKSDEAKSIIGDFAIDKVNYQFFYVYLFVDVINEIEDVIAVKEENEKNLSSFDKLDNSLSSFLDIYSPKLIKENKDQLGKMCIYCNFRDKCLIKRAFSLNMMWDK